MRIEIEDGSSLLRPMLNFRTSNDAPCLTTVSKTTLRICESMRCPSASTTSLWTDDFLATARLREDWQRERRLDVEIALGDFGQRAIQHGFGALLECGDEGQTILAELRELQNTVDVDAELGVR